eukprot:GFUD01041910.1.p1 GENE.GFUD01041910.1~~GFUD01041910.1.p1  ORF type:complete len:541 (-),score=80.66 GFUD01041910.1:26-1648(-)
MGEVDKFCLRWNDFEQNIIGAFKDLRTDRDFFDVSIVCKDETFQAHRVILAACSPTFREMIRHCSHHHPVLYLRGVRKMDLVALLDFMYHGETSLAEEELETFLATAEDLQIRGLTLNEEQQRRENERSRRVSGSNLANAVDDDVNNLLAGLDEPPSKRVKQETNREPERGFSITTASGATASSSIQEKIRIKQEQREQENYADENSLDSAKKKLASLPNSIVLQRVNENGQDKHSTPNMSYSYSSTPISTSTSTSATSAAEYTPPPGITMTKPASQTPTAPQPTPVNIRNILDVTKLSADQRNSELLKALNISNAQISASVASTTNIVIPSTSFTATTVTQINQQPAHQPRPAQIPQLPRPAHPQQSPRPAHPQISPRLAHPQLNARVATPQQSPRPAHQASHPLPQVAHPNFALNPQLRYPTPNTGPRIQLQKPPTSNVQQGVAGVHPDLARVQIQQAGRSSSPPVLHLPEGFNNFPVNTVGNIGNLLDAGNLLNQNSAPVQHESVDSDSSGLAEGRSQAVDNRRKKIILLKYYKKPT